MTFFIIEVNVIIGTFGFIIFWGLIFIRKSLEEDFPEIYEKFKVHIEFPLFIPSLVTSMWMIVLVYFSNHSEPENYEPSRNPQQVQKEVYYNQEVMHPVFQPEHVVQVPEVGKKHYVAVSPSLQSEMLA